MKEEDFGEGSVLCRIEHNPKDGRSTLRYKIQMVQESMIEEVWFLMRTSFVKQCNLSNSLGISDMEEDEEISNGWKNMLFQGLSLAAVLEEGEGSSKPGSIIGANVLILQKECVNPKMASAPSDMGIIPQTLEDCESVNVFKHYNCDRYVKGYGLVVLPAYQQKGIGFELLKAREEVCKKINCPVTATVFTSKISQHLAEKCGFETLAELDLSTYSKNNKLVYPVYILRYIKWMARRYF